MNFSYVVVLALGMGLLGWNAGQASAAPSEADVPSVVDAPAADIATPTPGALQGARCGDYSCDAPEDCHTCPQDCGDCCGNHRCEPPEDADSCPSDCG